MSANARVVIADTTFTWDGNEQRVGRGQVMDVAPGSALEDAIGADRLTPLYRTPPVTTAAPPPAPAPAAAAARKTTRGKARTEGGDGGE